jgi:hypothetical protein
MPDPQPQPSNNQTPPRTSVSTKSVGILNQPKSYGFESEINRLTEQPDYSFSNNGRNLIEGVAVFKWRHSNNMNEATPPVARRDQHPNNPYLWCWDVSTVFGRNGIATTTAKYVGIAGGRAMTDVEWNLSGSVGEQSVRFHPEFDRWVGQAAGDRMKIRLDEQGYFVSFGPNHPEVPAVEQFVAPAGSCSVSFYTNSPARFTKFQYGGLGKQFTLPPYCDAWGAELNVASFNLSWLLVSCNVTEYAKIYKVEMEFTLSVLGKPHNKYMYPLGSR